MALSPERREARRRNLIETAEALIRETGDAGFQMRELAARAGVSPATPYNLIGGKGEILRLVVRDEFASFEARLAALAPMSPLAKLAAATDEVVTHYEADRDFHRGLIQAAFGAVEPQVRQFMGVEGQTLWRGLVEAALASGELSGDLRSGPLTSFLLRSIAGVAEAWITEGWDEARFRLEMTAAVGLLLAAGAAEPMRSDLLARVGAAQRAIAGG